MQSLQSLMQRRLKVLHEISSENNVFWWLVAIEYMVVSGDSVWKFKIIIVPFILHINFLRTNFTKNKSEIHSLAVMMCCENRFDHSTLYNCIGHDIFLARCHTTGHDGLKDCDCVTAIAKVVP